MNDFATAQKHRRTLHGTRQVIEFNWPRYVAAGMVIVAGIWMAARTSFTSARLALYAAVFLASWWTIVSILASWYIYDATGLTEWRWLSKYVNDPARWANIHAGFDETTNDLLALFATTEFHVLDIFDSKVTTEHSIARARATAHPQTVTASINHIPLPDQSVDAVFMLFAAHEVRLPSHRTSLFGEIARVLAGGGQLIVVEHTRDFTNFLAFGPGYMHFLPRRAWQTAAGDSALHLDTQLRVNPFVTMFRWTKVS